MNSMVTRVNNNLLHNRNLLRSVAFKHYYKRICEVMDVDSIVEIHNYRPYCTLQIYCNLLVNYISICWKKNNPEYIENGTSYLQIRYTLISNNNDELCSSLMLSPECEGRWSSPGEKSIQRGFLEKRGLTQDPQRQTAFG